MAPNNELRNKVFGGGLTVAQDQTEAPEQTPAESEVPVTR